MVIDSHVHLGESIYGFTATPEEVLTSMEENGIDISIVVPNKPKDYNLIKANTYVAEQCGKYNQLKGLGRVDPWQGDAAIEEMKRCLDLGVVGFILNPIEDYYRVNRAITYPIAEFAAKAKMPIVIESGYPHLSHPTQVYDLARRYPEVTFVMTNGGELDLSGFTRGDSQMVLHNASNIVIGSSGLCSHEIIMKTVRELGPERLMFESAYPIMDTRLEILRITTADIPEESKPVILAENARRIFNI